MAYREFRDESTYDKPVFDWSFMLQAAQHRHEMFQQMKELDARKEAKKDDDLKDTLKGLPKGATEHPKLQKQLEDKTAAFVERVTQKDYQLTPKDKADEAELIFSAEGAKKADDSYKQTVSTIDNMAKEDPGFDYNSALKEANDIKVNSDSHLSALEKYPTVGDPVKHRDTQKYSNWYTSEKLKSAPTNKSGTTTETVNGVTKTLEVSQSAPYMMSAGRKKLSDGSEVETLKPIDNIQDMLPEVDKMFQGATGNVQKVKMEQEVTDNEISKAIDEINSGQTSVKLDKTKDASKVREALARQKQAKMMLDDNKKHIEINNKLTREQSRAVTSGERDNQWNVYSLGRDAKAYNDISGVKGGSGMAKTTNISYGASGFQNKNNKAATVRLNEQTVKNNNTGGYEKLVEGSEGTLDVVRGLVFQTNKNGDKITAHVGNKTKDTKRDIEDPNEYLESLTPKQIAEGGYQLGLGADITIKQAGGVSNVGLDPEESARLNTLKKELKDYTPTEDQKDENYNQDKEDKWDEMQALEASNTQKVKTVSVPYGQVEGQMQRIAGEKASEKAIVDSWPPKQREAYYKGKRIIARKKQEYQEQLKEKKQKTAEKKVRDDKSVKTVNEKLFGSDAESKPAYTDKKQEDLRKKYNY